jgi:hypothetical protein
VLAIASNSQPRRVGSDAAEEASDGGDDTLEARDEELHDYRFVALVKAATIPRTRRAGLPFYYRSAPRRR